MLTVRVLILMINIVIIMILKMMIIDKMISHFVLYSLSSVPGQDQPDPCHSHPGVPTGPGQPPPDGLRPNPGGRSPRAAGPGRPKESDQHGRQFVAQAQHSHAQKVSHGSFKNFNHHVHSSCQNV